MDIPYEKQFHFGNGTAAASLDELRDKIEDLSYQEFYHHVNSEKNDFASWIRHVLQDGALAADLEKVTSMVETVEIINDYLNPRPPEASRDDIQSKIEDEQEIHPPVEVEEVPAIPAHHMAEGETADFELIEEEIEKPEEPEGEADDTEAGDELQKYVLTADEKKQLILKDFIYGMLFGLLIGLLLGKILAF